MASLNWKQLLVAGIIVAAGAAGALYLLRNQHAGSADNESSSSDALISKATAAGRRRRKKNKKAAASNGTVGEEGESSQDSIVGDISNSAQVNVEKALTELAELCEKDSEQLQALPVEDKQKVFYALLLKGEALMNQEQIDAAVKYFAKALVLVPNPTEILGAFEKSLPEPVFTALLVSLQSEALKKTENYFETLASASDGSVRFHSTIVQVGEKAMRHFVAKTKKAVKKGEILYEEAPGMFCLTDPNADGSKYCDHCLKSLDDESKVVCEKDDTGYCSEMCKKASFDLYHMYVCKAREQAAESLDKLREYCQTKAKSGSALLMLRYVAMLLTEELKGNGAAVNGPFIHFDHLPQMFPAPTEADKEEAAMIRAVFTTSNDNLADFLTDQIYASMKGTLLRASFAVSLTNSLALNNETRVEPFRKVIGDNQDCDVTAYYHLTAHLPHSCAPNVALELVPESGCHVRAVAQCDIDEGQPISISFVPVQEMETPMRKEKLFLNFMLDCKCVKCTE